MKRVLRSLSECLNLAGGFPFKVRWHSNLNTRKSRVITIVSRTVSETGGFVYWSAEEDKNIRIGVAYSGFLGFAKERMFELVTADMEYEHELTQQRRFETLVNAKVKL